MFKFLCIEVFKKWSEWISLVAFEPIIKDVTWLNVLSLPDPCFWNVHYPDTIQNDAALKNILSAFIFYLLHVLF